MKEQNFKNHAKFVPLFHVVLLFIILVALILSVINLLRVTRGHASVYWHVPVILVLGSIVMSLLYYFVRTFSLSVQDRVIRAEENLRHFTLTGKLLNPKLEMSQIIALRFASDEELVPLVEKAINEKLSNNQIKELIKNWKADHDRV